MAIFGTKKNTEKKATSSAKAPSVAKAMEGKPSVKGKKAVATKAVKKVVEKKADKKADAVVAVASAGVGSPVADVILRPRITEKSGILSQGGVYTFEIATTANKNLVMKAVISLYKVTPVKVAIINSPAKKVFVRGRHGRVSGVRKAIVTLKEGDKIDFV